MKKPEYAIKSAIQIEQSGPILMDVIEFPPGTLIFPFWNDYYVPEHIKEKFKHSFTKVPSGDMLVTCIIGTHWVQTLKSNIRELQ